MLRRNHSSMHAPGSISDRVRHVKTELIRTDANSSPPAIWHGSVQVLVSSNVGGPDGDAQNPQVKSASNKTTELGHCYGATKVPAGHKDDLPYRPLGNRGPCQILRREQKQTTNLEGIVGHPTLPQRHQRALGPSLMPLSGLGANPQSGSHPRL